MQKKKKNNWATKSESIKTVNKIIEKIKNEIDTVFVCIRDLNLCRLIKINGRWINGCGHELICHWGSLYVINFLALCVVQNTSHIVKTSKWTELFVVLVRMCDIEMRQCQSNELHSCSLFSLFMKFTRHWNKQKRFNDVNDMLSNWLKLTFKNYFQSLSI